MSKVRLGSTDIVVDKNGFGALPIQRISFKDAAQLLVKAYENGITYFDTARMYSDSEAKIGEAFEKASIPRDKVYIATKTMAKDAEGFWADLEASLEALKTDYIDVYQFHNPAFCPIPGGDDGLYDAALKAKAEGKIRHIGITNHRLAIADEAIDSGLYETLQFPFSYLADEREIELARKCKAHDMGFIAMKGMSGGLITRADVAYAFCDQYDNVLPIWGVQRERELDDFLECAKNPPVYDNEMKSFVESERKELTGDFCRGCGYCIPCPAGIFIQDCARMSLMIRRAPVSVYMDEAHQAQMQQIKNCLHCGQCASRCPYGLDTPSLLEKNLADYEAALADPQFGQEG